MMEHQSEMTEILQELFDAPLTGKSHTTHGDKVAAVLLHFSEHGRTLEYCCDSKILNRAPSTLKAYCRERGIAFPDYTPMWMKKDAEKKAKEEANGETETPPVDPS